MQVLEEAGVEYDLVVGSSVGSLIGAFACSCDCHTSLRCLSGRQLPINRQVHPAQVVFPRLLQRVFQELRGTRVGWTASRGGLGAAR